MQESVYKFFIHSFMIYSFNKWSNFRCPAQSKHPNRHGDQPLGLPRVQRDRKQVHQQVILSHGEKWEGSELEAKITTRWAEEDSFRRCYLMGIWRTQGSQPWTEPKGRGAFWGNFTYKGPEAEKSPCVCVRSLSQEGIHTVSGGGREVGEEDGPVSLWNSKSHILPGKYIPIFTPYEMGACWWGRCCASGTAAATPPPRQPGALHPGSEPAFTSIGCGEVESRNGLWKTWV